MLRRLRSQLHWSKSNLYLTMVTLKLLFYFLVLYQIHHERESSISHHNTRLAAAASFVYKIRRKVQWARDSSFAAIYHSSAHS